MTLICSNSSLVLGPSATLVSSISGISAFSTGATVSGTFHAGDGPIFMDGGGSGVFFAKGSVVSSAPVLQLKSVVMDLSANQLVLEFNEPIAVGIAMAEDFQVRIRVRIDPSRSRGKHFSKIFVMEGF